MKVSILVPIYNVEEYIERCARSILEQTYDNIEVIFVNDYTEDRSMEKLQSVLMEYSDRNVSIIDHNHNKGLGAARITGLKHASGDFVMFVDSDDYLELQAVEKMVYEQKKNDSDIVIASFTHIFKNGKRLVEYPQHLSIQQLIKNILTRKTSLNVWAKLFKKSLFADNGINFINGINMGEDYVTISRLIYYVRDVSYIDQPVYNYIHINNNSYTYTYKHQNLVELLKAQSIVNDFYRNVGDKLLLKYHRIGNQKLKAELLILMLRSASHNQEEFKLINDLFVDENKIGNYSSYLKFQDRIVIALCRFVSEQIMALLIRIGFNIKQIVKV